MNSTTHSGAHLALGGSQSEHPADSASPAQGTAVIGIQTIRKENTNG